MRLMRLLRLLRLVKLANGSRLLRRYRASTGVALRSQSLLYCVAVLVTFHHWTACLFGMIGNDEGLAPTWTEEFDWVIDGAAAEQYFAAVGATAGAGWGVVRPTNGIFALTN